MTKQDYALRVGYLGVTTKEVAEELGALPSKVSEAVNVAVGHSPTRVALNNRIDAHTMQLVNEKRAEIKAQIGEVLKGDVQVILPADNRIVVVMDGELVGFYNPLAKKFVAVG